MMKKVSIIGDNIRKSRFNPQLADIVNKDVERRLKNEVKENRVKKDQVIKNNTKMINGLNIDDISYSFMRTADNYVCGMSQLNVELTQEDNAVHPSILSLEMDLIYRPLTFKENALIRIDDFETLVDSNYSVRTMSERRQSWKYSLDSCTGILCMRNSETLDTTAFKLSNECDHLITTPRDAKNGFIDFDEPCMGIVSFEKFDGQKFHASKGIYNKLLTKKQFLEHEAYRFLFDEDTAMMTTYWDIASDMTPKNPSKLMAFKICTHTGLYNELRALFADSIYMNCNCIGNDDLNKETTFLRLDKKVNK